MRSMRRTLLRAAALALFAVTPAAGQGPDAAWRTIEVPGYRVHFPAPAAAWATHLAARLPAVRERVAAAVGHDDAAVVDVVLADPLAQANGSAWPLLGAPRMVLLLTPPEAGSALDEHGDWPELLAIHEQAHLSHLLRPSRRPLRRALGLPVGPLATKAPRWVTEGYATVLEGRLTGRGRPNGALRAAVLRRWAQRGRLPSYGALSAGYDRWLGGAMAYLAGSAFLEWLEARAAAAGNPASLNHLWRRLSARQGRDFEEAFRGVWGEPPATLWGRFTAELTWKAMEAERRLTGELAEGEAWLERDWGTGGPALSADGERLVLTLHARHAPPRLAVYATADDLERAAREERRRGELLARDPADVAAVPPAAPQREPLATLELPFTSVDPAPRFLADGSVLFARSLPRGDGTLHADLFRWWPGDGRVARVTHGADVKAADPAPDGSWAVAVRSRWGETALVRVDLASGGVTELTAANLTTLYDAPRISPEGGRIAYLRHDGERWRLLVRPVAQGVERVVPAPDGAALADPAWDPAGDALFAVVGEGGLLDLQRLPLSGGPPQRLTRSLGAALAPAPHPRGDRLYFLSLAAGALDVRRLNLGGARAVTPPALDAELTPAVPGRAATDPPPPLALATVPASRAYGLGRAEWSLLTGGSYAAASGSSLEAGLRGGDLLGRWELLALGGLGEDGAGRGGALTAAWRGWPVTLGAHLFAVEERPTQQPRPVGAGGAALDGERRGLELAATLERTLGPGRRARVRLALARDRFAPLHGVERERDALLLSLAGGQELRRGEWRGALAADLEWQPGETAGESWARRAATLGLTLGHGEGPTLRLDWQRAALSGTVLPEDALQVGGLPGSLLPPTALGSRAVEPALPSAALLGRQHEGQRVALDLGGAAVPVRAFLARHRVQPLASGEPWSDWLGVAGLEVDLALERLALLRLPGLRLRAGAAYVLDEPYAGDVNGWLGLAYGVR